MALTKTRRRAVGVASVTVALALVAACGNDATTDEPAEVAPASEDEQVELTMWFGREDFIPDDAFDAFHDEYPHITVSTDVLPLEEAATNFIRRFDSNDSPDLFQMEFDEAPLLAERGMLFDLAEVLDVWEEEDPELFGNMADIAWDMATWNGTTYGMALHYGPFYNTYRTDLFEEAGVEVPTTWDDVLEAGRAITERTDAYGYGDNASREQFPTREIGVFGQMGGQWEDGVMQIDSEAGHYFLEFYQTLMRDGIASPDIIAWNSGDLRAAFIGGVVAQMTEGLNVFPEFNSSMEYGTEWGVSAEPFHRPGAEEDSRYLAGGWPYFVSAQTEHPYEVGLVLRYLADYDQSLSVALRYQPVSNVAAMTSDEYSEANPFATEEILAALEASVPRPAHINQAAMLDVLKDATQWAIQNPDGDVAEAAARFQAEFDAVHAETQ